ncbi:MAG: hypothetical protein II474_09305, partial [Firmicutes bacterium]|nr:hypothetical protein [Bacillota bacterium]
AMAYLESMDVYAAFIELDGKTIRTKTVDGKTVADTEVTQLTHDNFNCATDGAKVQGYYDANPTVVCDMETGDAIVYYIKSDRVYTQEHKDGETIGEYINPYTNDSVVSYMLYSKGNTGTRHWLFDYYYPSEIDTSGMDEEMIEAFYRMMFQGFGGQRFLDGPISDENERYAIPDFTAIGYDGLAVCAYTVDPDGSSDTDADKELYLQVYDFNTHKTKYQTALTNDGLADTLPQLFRSRVNTGSGEAAHTKLFWYRDGKQVVYIDVTELLEKGLNADGTLKKKADGSTNYTYTDEDGVRHTAPDTREYIYTDASGMTHSRFTDPQVVFFYASDRHAALQSADFQAVEDAAGNLYILWTEGVTDEDGSTAREIFGTGLVSYERTYVDEDGKTVTDRESTGWSLPYRITEDGFHNDELAAAMSGESLVVVHNRYSEELNRPDSDTATQGDKSTYSGETAESPLIISDMALVADTLEPCGSVETERIRLYGADGAAVTLPRSGDELTIEVDVSNNGMNTAQGYKLSLYAGDTLIDEIVCSDALVPNSSRTHTFRCTMPESVEGLVFQVVAQEMKDAGSKLYYNDRETFLSDPLEAKAAYRITNVETYQTTDGFRAAFTVTNTGNAASSGEDTLNVKLRGPANLGDLYTDALYKEKISLAVDESKDFDIPVGIRSEMMEDYGFVTALISVQKETAEQSASGAELNSIRYLSNMVYADFDLAAPMDMELQDVSVKADNSADIVFAMNLGDRFGNESGSVTYAVDDLTIARVENGKVVGVSNGETTLHATHTATGATVSATVTVSDSTPDKPDRDHDSGSDPAGDANGAAPCDRGASCPMSAYSDLDKTAWYHDGVHWALENGVMTGFG